MRRMRSLSRNNDSDIEIVEDSEPERVQLRINSANDTGLPQRNTMASGMHYRLGNAGLHTTATVIEISDSEASTSSCGKNAIIYGSAPVVVNPVKDQRPSKSTIDVKNFAFRPLSTKQQVQPPIALLPQPPERRRAPKKVRMNLDSLLSEIARVSRCVSCSISWTTRKTAAQKLEHIQRCAKKKGYDDETVRIMIKNEITSSKESNIGHGKGPSTHSTSTTLLEDVVQPRSNKRKNVYPNNQLAVGSPFREAILSRAKDIIDGPSPDEASPQMAARRKLALDFPFSQTFTASTLLQRSSKTPLFSATGQDVDFFPEPHIDIGTLPTHSNKSIGDERGDHRKDTDVRRDLPQVTLQKLPSRKVNKGAPKALEEVETSLNEVAPPAEKVLPKVRSSAKKRVSFGDEWEMFMKERIREDNDLNLRVIRYEPVDFSLFLKLARLYAPSSSEGALKNHLRHLLDNQSINFYERNA